MLEIYGRGAGAGRCGVLASELGKVVFCGVVETVEWKYSDDDSLQHLARVCICRIEPECFVAVHKAGAAELEAALHFDTMRHKLPVGWLVNGQTAYLNHDFLCGEKGAHVNVAGISGVATKTSYALFLLYSLFQGPAGPKSRGILFNVKGDDLLHLHQPNARLSDQDRARYAQLGLPCGPFEDVQYFARGRGLWTLREFAEKRLFRFLFIEPGQPSNLDMLVERVADLLQQQAATTAGPELVVEGTTILRLSQLGRLLLDASEDTQSVWFDKAAPQTRQALVRRLSGSCRQVEPLLRSGTEDVPSFGYERRLTVVDLHYLQERAKAFVLASVMQCLYEGREAQGPDHPQIYLVLDELNKYAPRYGTSVLKDMLLDVAERGRSLGIVLVGAEQTASEIEERVVSNASVRVAGRLEAAESLKDSYSWLTGNLRQRACLIQPGTMVVQQPEIPTPLLIRFPFPAWATRAQEVAG